MKQPGLDPGRALLYTDKGELPEDQQDLLTVTS
ncbi:hypothetical protein RKD28_000242 [Streptomyces sp. SAI-229]